MPELLIELLSEEIPARMQAQAARELETRIVGGLEAGGLSREGVESFATPRRLALVVRGLPDRSPDREEERRGPKVGAPDSAVEGFLRGAGVGPESLEERDTPKGRFLFVKARTPGRPVDDIVSETLESAIRGFKWPKSMRWGTGDLRWVRPLRSILCVLSDPGGSRSVPAKVGDLVSGAETSGHRFMAPERFEVSSFDEYRDRLAEAKVELAAPERAARVRAGALERAAASGLELVDDEDLVAENAGLAEWPVALDGEIEAEFLDLPPEVLRCAMRVHQKFLSLRDPESGRIERFVAVADREAADGGASILAGNSKVLSARLADAKFFWENDLRVAREGMSEWAVALDATTFHGLLGTQGERVARIAALAGDIAPAAGADPEAAREAAKVAKLDLASEMVFEFPELQGTMGRHYVAASGRHDAAAAAAAEEHYAPAGPSDDVPRAPVSVAVALADKLDTLVGFWIIDEKPTGSKDPFALRRAALGVIRIVLENDLRLPLLEAASRHAGRFPDSARASAPNGPDVARDLVGFVHERMKVFLREEGLGHDVIDACVSIPGSDDLADLVRRARALAEVLGTEDGENMVQGFRRANNLLVQAEDSGAREGGDPDASGRGLSILPENADAGLAETESERALFAALDSARAGIGAALEAGDYPAAMSAMARLRAPVDAFFEDVQVNADDARLRQNRLGLLARMRETCAPVADLSRIEG